MHANIEELLALRDGVPVEAQVTQHMNQCTDCSRELARLISLKNDLRQLRAFEPAGRTWTAVSEHRQGAPRRWNPLPVAALAAGMIIAVLVLPLMHRGSAPATRALNPANDDLDALVVRSQRLDAVLQVLPQRPRVERVGTSATIDDLQNRILLLDLQLSAASEDDRQRIDARRLWGARVELMNSLVHVRYAEAAGTADLAEPSSNLGAI